MICNNILLKYSKINDPRFVSENELLDFIQENAHKIDLTLASIESSSFKCLPPEVQHSIILDLKLQSRQPSKERLDSIVSNSKDALDFSKNQIEYLVKRNYWTEKSMEVAKTSRYVITTCLNLIVIMVWTIKYLKSSPKGSLAREIGNLLLLKIMILVVIP